ncbi:MAG: tetratricopeptide repeat protein [Herpetosiphonaceae bacterium]|nr:tetratricopeptide repeat protein [Herpetosiphonaceae bacterium]
MDTHPGSLTQLPHYETPLIGRMRATNAVLDLLRSSSVRLLTLVGESGTGKTRLSLQVAEIVGSEFPDGQYFVALAPVDNPTFVVPTIAQTLNILESSEMSLIESIAQFCGDKKMLLLLDNIEQVRAASAEVVMLLERTTNLKILVTSQVPLEVANETTFAVPPLALPDPNTDLEPAALLNFSAIALFVDRIQAVQHKFVLTKQQAPAVVEICRQVQGLPLAIELIAAHSAALSPSDLLMLVRNRLALSRTSPSQGSRNRILTPVLDWCYSRLDPAAQTLFSRLGVFVGGSTNEAINSIYQALDQTKPTISVLVDKHLVMQEELPGQMVRYIMLDAIREYAHQRLHKLNDYTKVFNQHLDYYVKLSKAAYDGWRGSEQLLWTQRLNAEIHNLRAAIVWSLRPALAEQSLALCAAMWRFWYAQGHLSEGRRWLEQAIQNNPNPKSVALADALNSAGILAHSQGDYLPAEGYFEQSAALQREHGNVLGLSRTLNNLGMIAHGHLEYEKALAYSEESVQSSEQLNEQMGAAGTLGNIGLILAAMGRIAEAQAAHDRSLRLRREFGSASEIANCLENLGSLALHQGQLPAAEDYLAESLALYAAVADKTGTSFTQITLAHVKVCQGALAMAQLLLVEALYTDQELSNLAGLSNGFVVGILLLTQTQQYQQAAQLAGRVRHLRQAIGAPLPHYDQITFSTLETQLQQMLGAQDWQEHIQSGEALSNEAAIALIAQVPITAD